MISLLLLLLLLVLGGTPLRMGTGVGMQWRLEAVVMRWPRRRPEV